MAADAYFVTLPPLAIWHVYCTTFTSHEPFLPWRWVRMPNRDRAIACEGALALLTFTLMLGVAARGLRPQPGPPEVVRANALVLQEPQNKPSPDPLQSASLRPGSAADKSTIFTGTIVRHGSDFVLRERSGSPYRLDAPLKAQQYEGRPVRVTGRLEEVARMIHVESIEEIAA